MSLLTLIWAIDELPTTTAGHCAACGNEPADNMPIFVRSDNTRMCADCVYESRMDPFEYDNFERGPCHNTA